MARLGPWAGNLATTHDDDGEKERVNEFSRKTAHAVPIIWQASARNVARTSASTRGGKPAAKNMISNADFEKERGRKAPAVENFAWLPVGLN